MFIISKKSFLNIFLCFLWATLIAKLIALLIGFILPVSKYNINTKIDTSLPYIQFPLKRDFALEIKIKKIKKEKPTLLMKNMLLKGVYIDGADSFAIIGLKTKQNSVKIIPIKGSFHGYKLIKLYPKKVLLQKNNITYSLFFKIPKAYPSAKNTSSNVHITSNFSGKKQFVLTKHDVYYYINHFNKIWENIGIDDSRKNGNLIGFKIKWIRPDSIFAKIGLKKGDILVKVNGKPLTNYGIAFDYYKKIKKREIGTIKLTVLRNKKEKEIEYELF